MAKRSRSMVCSGARGGGVLWVKRSRSMACFGAGGGGVLWVMRSRSTACSRARGIDMLQVKRSTLRAKQLSGVEGVLRRRWRAPGVGVIEDLKRMSAENLQSMERAMCAPDIYIGARCTASVH
jgi:hypothetical protein